MPPLRNVGVVAVVLVVVLCSCCTLIGAALPNTVILYLNAAAPAGGNGSQAAPWAAPGDAWTAINSLLSDTSDWTITLNVAPGTYNLGAFTSTVSLPKKQLSIIGQPSNPTAVKLKCSAADSFVSFTTATGLGPHTLTLAYLDVVECKNPLYVKQFAQVTLQSIRMRSGPTPSNAKPTIEFDQCTNVNVYDSTFTSNNGAGSGIVHVLNNNGGQAVFSNCYLANNVFGNAQAVLTIEQNTYIVKSTIESNQGSPTSAVISVQNGGAVPINVTIEDSVIQQNTINNVIYALSATPSKVYITGATDITSNLNANASLVASGFDEINIGLLALVLANNQDVYECGTNGAILDGLGTNRCNVACQTTAKLDPCYVCGGNHDCVDCNNIPFGNSTCSSHSSNEDGNNDTSDCVVEWDDNSPSPRMAPENGSKLYLNVTLGNIEEWNPSGQLVKLVNMDTMPWIISVPKFNNTSKYQRRYRYFATDSDCEIILDQILYREPTNTSSGGVSFSINRNSLKLALKITEWPFKAPGNYLVFYVNYKHSEPAIRQTVTLKTRENGFNISSYSITTQNTKVHLNIQEFAVIDNVTQGIAVTEVNNSADSATFCFVIPQFDLEMEYDPDFGVVLASSSSGDGGSSADTGLIVGLTVGLVGAAILAVVLVLLVALLFIWYKRIRHNSLTEYGSSSMVNFDNSATSSDEEASTN